MFCTNAIRDAKEYDNTSYINKALRIIADTIITLAAKAPKRTALNAKSRMLWHLSVSEYWTRVMDVMKHERKLILSSRRMNAESKSKTRGRKKTSAVLSK